MRQNMMQRIRIPVGMKDILPEETALLEKLEQDLNKLFHLWSYDKVITPTIEYAACVQPNVDREDQLYKFFDRQGRVLAIRPEFTTPIARLVSSRMRSAELPLRLSYSGDVFRYGNTRQREFRQAGVELIGASSALADAEIIALAVEAFRCLGLKDFQFNLGEMGVFAGLIEETGIREDTLNQLEYFLGRKDIVAIEVLVNQSNLPERVRDIILRLPHLHGGVEILDEVLSLSNLDSVRQAVENLKEIYGYLEDFGVQDAVALDMGILRGFTYYSGVIFEGYVAGVGFPVVEGGRYDALYSEFNNPLPATGFAVNLGGILDLFSTSEIEKGRLVQGENPTDVIRRCRELRAQGQRVQMML